MPVTFPKEAHLRDTRRVIVRPFTSDDVDAVFAFFQSLPDEVRRYAWDRIDTRAVVEKWGRDVDHDKVVSLLALDGTRVVADASMHYREVGPLRLAGRIKWLLDPEYRGDGLGTIMVQTFIEMAKHNGLRHLTCMLVGEIEADAVQTLRGLGFDEHVLAGYGTGPDGHPKDMVKMILEL
jgi:GNAT superfamily N-acetyltransferase